MGVKHMSLALGLAALSLTACTTDPLTGERKLAKAGIGAGVGAAVGAGIGAIAGKRKATLIGAGVGAIVGGGVGAYMDAQEKKLREELADTGIQVVRDGDQIYLNMPSAITFETDAADLSPQFGPILNDIGGILQEYPKTYIDVAGHTDSTGADAYNMDLSIRRAQTVGNYLAGQGVLQERILTRGFGESQPLADNASAAGRSANRRVEIALTPVTQ
jgi:outer membrane protein OmpA-like peptidoglycan-associated protein